ncbi:MAG: hypothetical protein DRP29_04800 [Thermodesulfobacteriota bacterium]|nr:MAG: hypothetical protein DRP29_04800 [Thermodesulfobacteriota bacterium]
MEKDERTLRLIEIVEDLKKVFLEKGYPESILFTFCSFTFTLDKLNFNFKLPLVVKEENKIYFVVDYKPASAGLASFERGLLALARVLFHPLPFYSLLTNLEKFLLINNYTCETKNGGKNIIPFYEEIKTSIPSRFKQFNMDIEKKILALYLSGGCKDNVCALGIH